MNRRSGFGINQLDGFVEFLNTINERRFAVAHERRQARHSEQMRARWSKVHPANEPFFIPCNDPAARWK